MCILPTLTYGAQTLSRLRQKSALGVCQRAMERIILGVKLTDRIRNSMLRYKTQIADDGQTAAKLKWKWAGHICRMPEALWAKITTQLVPNGRKLSFSARQTQEEMARWAWRFLGILAPEGNRPRKMKRGKGGLCPAVGHHRLIIIIIKSDMIVCLCKPAIKYPRETAIVLFATLFNKTRHKTLLNKIECLKNSYWYSIDIFILPLPKNPPFFKADCQCGSHIPSILVNPRAKLNACVKGSRR